mgnify:CR=1 FL=1
MEEDKKEKFCERMTTKEAAAYCKLSYKTLNGYRCSGLGPEFIKLGRRVFYKKCDVDAWIEQNSGFKSTVQAKLKQGGQSNDFCKS